MILKLSCDSLELHVVPVINRSRTIEHYALTLVSVDGSTVHTIHLYSSAASVQKAAYHFAECYEEAMNEGYELSPDMERFVSPTGYEVPINDSLDFEVSPDDFRDLLRAVKHLGTSGLLQ